MKRLTIKPVLPEAESPLTNFASAAAYVLTVSNFVFSTSTLALASSSTLVAALTSLSTTGSAALVSSS